MGIPGCVGPVSDGDRCELDYREGNSLSGDRYWHSSTRERLHEVEEREPVRGSLHDRYQIYVDSHPGGDLLSFDEWING